MTPQTALPAAFSNTFLSEHNDGEVRTLTLIQLGTPEAEAEITIKRRLSLEELYGCATAAVTYGGASIDLEALQNAEHFARYFKCTAIGHYLLLDDRNAVFPVEHRKLDDRWSLRTAQYGWINQELINRKLSQQSAA